VELMTQYAAKTANMGMMEFALNNHCRSTPARSNGPGFQINIDAVETPQSV
jgi:hypothetical protein